MNVITKYCDYIHKYWILFINIVNILMYYTSYSSIYEYNHIFHKYDVKILLLDKILSTLTKFCHHEQNFVTSANKNKFGVLLKSILFQQEQIGF